MFTGPRPSLKLRYSVLKLSAILLAIILLAPTHCKVPRVCLATWKFDIAKICSS